MRRALKLKAYFILLAWMTIFVHNVIPHNHIEENVFGCHDLIHNSPESRGVDAKSPVFVSQPCEVTVCHVSNFLFHTFSQEDLFTSVSQIAALKPVGLQEEIIVFPEEKHASEHYPGCFLLRAPPAA